MSTHKCIDTICCVVLAVVLVLTAVFMNGEVFGIQTAKTILGYEAKLFDTSTVHTINILMDDWDTFIENCANEEYVTCTVVIDNEAYKNVAIRAKGNTSLTQVQSYGNGRYSFKIEFDHYDNSKTYYGLDKLCLNNIIQDTTYMKDYLTYQMMGYFGVATPLCSYTYITVNGEDWGLYLAVEGVEEAFLQRNYGSDCGELYKPDSMDMGGGRGNGENFNVEDMKNFFNGDNTAGNEENSAQMPGEGRRPDGDRMPQGGMDFGGRNSADGRGGMGASMGSDDVALIYTDDEYDSYSNILDNAKTDISDRDKDRLISSLKKLNEREDIEAVVNVEEVIRYFVVHNFVLNFDSYTGSMIHNYYLYEENGQLSMIPWDYNLAFGGFQSASDATSLVNYPIDTPVSGGTIDSRPMLAWIFASEEYTEQYHQYFAELISQYFDSGYFENMIGYVGDMISPYVQKDPTKFCTYEEFEEGLSTLKEFCLLRAESVKGQLEGTIASTSEGQEQNSVTRIDASDIVISAMGSMGNTVGEGGGPDNFMGVSEDQDAMSSDQPPDQPDGEVEDSGSFGSMGEAPQMPADMAGGNFGGGGAMPDMSRGENAQDAPASSGRETWILLGVSTAVLLLGLAVAFVFKRR